VLVRSPKLADDDLIVATKLSNAADGLLAQPARVESAEPIVAEKLGDEPQQAVN